jgi:NDP-sugar pyrophosphorylase family protein
MKLYAHQGVREFVLALGYKAEVVKLHFLNYHYLHGSFSIDLRRLLALHRLHGKLATVTAVRPPARFGGLLGRRCCSPGRAGFWEATCSTCWRG